MEIRFRRGSIHLDRCAPPGGSAALMGGSIEGADGGRWALDLCGCYVVSCQER